VSRDLSSAMLTRLAAAAKRPALFFEGVFASGPVNLWSGTGEIVWDSKTWLGAGQFGGVSNVQDSIEFRATSATVMLSGIPQSILDKAIGEYRRNKDCTLWLGFFDDDWSLVADPEVSFAGKMDPPVIDEGSATATISIRLESRVLRLNQANQRRYTNEDQQLDFPNDLGFEFVPSIQEKEVIIP
tara:strand:+ start:833 stop:1387 length:555 start_codon:yes stop_codon:yes gene_type:complete